MNDSLFVALQRIAPHHLLSRCAGHLANCETPWIKNQFIQWFANRYHIDMSQAAEENLQAYSSFNAFFTRALKANARPIDSSLNSIVCPADGTVSQAGIINDGRIFQAKGHDFTVQELLGGNADAARQYKNGEFTTIYLSPRDYHRVHMPCEGQLTAMTHVPGRLFSVNQVTTEMVPRLFARNERVVCHFTGEHGPFAVVLVGAMIVASIETVWAGQVAPLKRGVTTTQYGESPPIHLQRGEEMGRFLLGSTVILLFPESRVEWRDHFVAGTTVNMGEGAGDWKQ